jgi:hypothetical protein
VRGYNVGELAASRSFAEGAAEVRVPVAGKTVYGFYEYGTDLGSSKLVKGNPTEYYRRAGRCNAACPLRRFRPCLLSCYWCLLLLPCT